MDFYIKKEKSSFSDETEKEHNHGNHSNRAMGFLADDVTYFHLLIILVKIIKKSFYEVYGYFSRGLVFSEKAKEMQCMRKSNEEMLMNAS